MTAQVEHLRTGLIYQQILASLLYKKGVKAMKIMAFTPFLFFFLVFHNEFR